MSWSDTTKEASPIGHTKIPPAPGWVRAGVLDQGGLCLRGGLDGGRLGGVADLGDRVDQATDGCLLRVVLDKDASGGELHFRGLHAVETVKFVLDFGYTARAAELIGAQGGLLQLGRGGHDNQVLIVVLSIYLTLLTVRAVPGEFLDLDQTKKNSSELRLSTPPGDIVV